MQCRVSRDMDALSDAHNLNCIQCCSLFLHCMYAPPRAWNASSCAGASMQVTSTVCLSSKTLRMAETAAYLSAHVQETCQTTWLAMQATLATAVRMAAARASGVTNVTARSWMASAQAPPASSAACLVVCLALRMMSAAMQLFERERPNWHL